MNAIATRPDVYTNITNKIIAAIALQPHPWQSVQQLTCMNFSQK